MSEPNTKTTFMRIKVDLQCPRCRKKIKKLLCKIPQVQDQQYKEKENLVIKVVCCSPEKIKQKIICKGGDIIKRIEIKETEKKTKPPDEKEKPPKEDTEPVSKPPVEPVCVPVRPVGFGTCCKECYEGHDGGPCHYGHGRPPLCNDGYYGRPIYDTYGGGWYRRSCYAFVSRCNCDSFGEEPSSGCSSM
ncbi:hypothetical protein ACB098_05G156800 [Castanea mollissima]